MADSRYIRSFDALRLGDTALVGGKTASLGELRRLLRGQAVQAPRGFAITAEAYRDALTTANARASLSALLADLDVSAGAGGGGRGAGGGGGAGRPPPPRGPPRAE
jgi:pyruvate,water dikinase